MNNNFHTIRLSDEQEKQLNEYVLKIAQKKGEIIYGMKTKLFRWAFKEWMDKHGDDYDIDWTGETPGSKE